MKIFTSYFSNYRNFPKDCAIYSIVRYNKNWNEYPNLIGLSPSEEILSKMKNGDIDEKEFAIQYLNDISEIDLIDFFNKLSLINDNKDILLLCYEKKGDFCHRHLLSMALNNLGIESKEL